MEKELALKRDARQFSDTKMVDTAILPGVSFMAVSPLVVPKPRLGTLPHRQERLNAQAWPVRQFRIPVPCYRRRSGRVVRQRRGATGVACAPLAQSRAKRKRDVTLESGAVLTKHSPVRCPGKHNVSIQE
jgi:hypothetical protein